MVATNQITLRRFAPDDAPAVSRLIIENLLLVNSRDYGEAAARQLARFYAPEWLAEYARNGEMLVALEEAEIVGTAALEQDRVRNVFVRVDCHQRGVGRLLMRSIEEAACRQRQTRLVLHASVSAVDFYRRLGYQPLEEIEETIGATSIKMLLMEKIIRPPDY